MVSELVLIAIFGSYQLAIGVFAPDVVSSRRPRAPLDSIMRSASAHRVQSEWRLLTFTPHRLKRISAHCSVALFFWPMATRIEKVLALQKRTYVSGRCLAANQ